MFHKGERSKCDLIDFESHGKVKWSFIVFIVELQQIIQPRHIFQIL